MNRQEIIEGLEHCIKNDRYPGGDCAKCPLYPAKGETDACMRCIDNLMHNAAWLLRQDAPERNAPLALEDAGALPRMVWLEVRGSPGKAQPSILMDTGRPICHLQLYGRWYNEYGRTWRMWPQQPTTEEMENTPWEDETCCTN